MDISLLSSPGKNKLSVYLLKRCFSAIISVLSLIGFKLSNQQSTYLLKLYMRITNRVLGKINLKWTAAVGIIGFVTPVAFVLASGTSNFQQTINSGSLSTDIVDASYVSVSSPTVAMSTATFSFTCHTVTGTFGSSSQKIYVSNPDAADNGWTLTVAASAVTSVWDGAVSDFDFNDSTSSGCTDGADSGDTVGGQMTINASAGTLATGSCAACATTNITKGSSAAFVSGTTDSVTLLTAATTSSDIGDWTLTGVTVSQTIPAEQGAASDYDINMVLTATAS